MKKNEIAKLILLIIFTLSAYIPTFAWMAQRWTVADTYYSHGFLVPLISLFIVWLKRNELLLLPIKPSAAGWVFFAAGIITHIISALLRVYFTSGFSILLVLTGLVLLFLGKDHLKIVAFPILFLLFMIPLPLLVIANFSFRLKILAAKIATFLVNTMGVAAIREGSIINTVHSQVAVEDPCSGIRSLIALIALGSLMAYFRNISKFKKAIVFSCSIPIAIGTNVFRIVILILASEIYGTKFAMGAFHDMMGLLVFVLAFISLSFVAKMLE